MFLYSLPLRWGDLTKAVIPTRDNVEAVVRPRLALCPPNRVSRVQAEHQLTHALVDHFGLWCMGWNWAASEPGGGGAVHGWCCANHSIRRKDEDGDEPTIGRAIDAVIEWASFVEFLSHRFGALERELDGLPLAEMTERAATALLPMVLERTQATDAWYGTFSVILSWFLQSQGHASLALLGEVLEVTSGRFESWVEPSTGDAERACADLGVAVSSLDPDEPAVDSLGVWLRHRGRVEGYDVEHWKPGRALSDAHVEYIETVDRARSDIRADGLRSALERARAWARAGSPLSFAELSSWQAHILGGTRPGFRTERAVRGHQVYGFDPKLPLRFERCLAEALDPSLPWSTRAARLYLDVRSSIPSSTATQEQRESPSTPF